MLAKEKNYKQANKRGITMEYTEEEMRIILTDKEKEKCFMRLGMLGERYKLDYVYSYKENNINGIKITNKGIDYIITDFKIFGFEIMAKLVENGTSAYYGIKELLNYIKGGNE